MIAPTRPALRYHGAKWRLAPWILAHLPEHYCYVEPFGGGAGVLLQKQPSSIEVYNDLNGAVVNFFRVLRDQPDSLIRAIELTPFSRAEFDEAHEPTADPLEAARRFYVLSWQGHGAPTADWNTGWRCIKDVKHPGVNRWNSTDHLWIVAARLKLLQVDNEPASSVIERFDDARTLFYCDPPYVHSTRGLWRLGSYGKQHEMTDADHRGLAEQLHGVKGMVVISGYPSPLYEELYGDWHRVSCQAATRDNSKIATECLWLSPAVTKRSRQRSLFDFAETA